MGSYTPHHAISTIRYLKDLELYKHEKPFQILTDIPESARDQRFTNLEYEEVEETFSDIRGNEDTFTLNDHGFTYRHHNFNFDQYENREAVEADYLPKIEELIKEQVEDVDKIFIFDWRVC